MSKKRYFIKLAYNGKNYHGWQIQPNAISVQEVLTDCLSKLLKEKIEIVGCGRTDTGVHAKDFYAHFNIDKDISDIIENNLVLKLNSFLPKEIVVFDIYEVDINMHARFSAKEREYRYFLVDYKDIFAYEQNYYYRKKLDLDLMNKACDILLDTEDFESFSKVHTDVNTFICDLKYAKWRKEGDEIVFTIRADRFLRNMVRAIVGTLLDVGTLKISIDEFKEIVESRSRKKAGTSVPAHALFLWDIKY